MSYISAESQTALPLCDLPHEAVCEAGIKNSKNSTSHIEPASDSDEDFQNSSDDALDSPPTSVLSDDSETHSPDNLLEVC